MIVGLVSGREVIVRKFEVEIPENDDELFSYNIRKDSQCLFLSSEKPNRFITAQYGMTPSWSGEPVKHYQAPIQSPKAECKDGVLRKDIIRDTVFRKSIRSQRGLLPVDYFIVPGKDNIPFLVFPIDKKYRPIALGCLWDYWKKEITDPLTYGFAILTIPAYGVFKDAGIEYMPLVIDEHRYRKWLKPGLLLTEVTELLVSVPKTELNAYPISPAIWTSTENDKSLLLPQGERLMPEKKPQPRPILDKFQRKKVHDDPGFVWGYKK